MFYESIEHLNDILYFSQLFSASPGMGKERDILVFTPYSSGLYPIIKKNNEVWITALINVSLPFNLYTSSCWAILILRKHVKANNRFARGDNI